MAVQKQNHPPIWAYKLIAFTILSILAMFALVYILFQITDLLSWVLLALFLSFALEPLVNQLEHRGWNRRVATATVITAASAAIILLIAAMVPLIIEQFNEIIRQSPTWLSKLVDTYNNIAGTSITESQVVERLTSSSDLVNNYAGGLAGNIFEFGKQLFYGLLQILGVLLFTYYLVQDGPKLRRMIFSFLSIRQQRVVLNTWELAIDKTGSFMFSRLILGGISVLVHFIILLLLGVPFALPLALWMGIISQFVPIIGTYIAAALPILVALLQGPGDALVLAAFIVVYQQVENYMIGPKVAAQTMLLHPAVAFGAVIAGASIGGIVGAFLALPLAAILQEVAKIYFRQKRTTISPEIGKLNSTKAS